MDLKQHNRIALQQHTRTKSDSLVSCGATWDLYLINKSAQIWTE